MQESFIIAESYIKITNIANQGVSEDKWDWAAQFSFWKVIITEITTRLA